MKVYTPEDLRFADKYTIENLGVSGVTLMDRAADALFDGLKEYIGKSGKFVILCGKGNNGGDGWAVGMKLCRMFEKTVCIAVCGTPSTGDALYFYDKCTACEKENFPIRIINSDTPFTEIEDEISSADVIVDAIFGTGFSGSIEKDTLVHSVIEAANKKVCHKISADIPSGANALTGKCSAVTFKANKTVTFAKPKIGMLSYPARSFCGKITVADIGIPEEVFEMRNTKYEASDNDLIRQYLPERNADSNKGTFGKLLVYAGSPDMTGAAHLALY